MADFVTPDDKAGSRGVSVIARPLAEDKFESKSLKLVAKAKECKKIFRGVKEVVKAIRKGEKGVVILAGDVHPLNIVAHIPVYCEENNIPYFFVRSKHHLGIAAGTKQSTSVVFVAPPQGEEDKKSYDKIIKKAETAIASIQTLSIVPPHEKN